MHQASKQVFTTNFNMDLKKANSIDEVIYILDKIILESENNSDTIGYFSALYRKVTIKVKEGINNNFFDDGPRMEKLDVVFANRFLKAYYLHRNKEPITNSWRKVFDLSTKYWPIVLQHLLMGMNAHINLDLGIAAVEVSGSNNINDLENDFNKINEILSSLVIDVQQDLGKIWPTFKAVLKLTGKMDDFLVDFSMKLARDGAWKFAKSIADLSDDKLDPAIKLRDSKVAQKTELITNPGFVAVAIFRMIRLGERGSVSEKIAHLK